MWRRGVPMLLACALVTAACGQEPPARRPLPELPEELVFPTLTATTLDPVPDDGTCYLVQSVGAYVSSIQPGYDAGNLLEPGDVITGIDGTPVTSQETLIAAVSSRAPGERLVLTFERDGAPQDGEVELGWLPEDPTQARLGVLVEPSLTATPPDEVTGDDGVTASTHVTIADDRLFALDPLAGRWYPTGASDPGAGVVLIDGRIYIQDPGGGAALEPIGGGEVLPVQTGGRDLLRILATVGDVLVALVGDIDTTDPGLARNVSVLGVDLVSDRIVWSWAPQGITGEAANPVFGFRSPDGTRALLTLEIDGETVLTLIDAAGTVLAGFGSDIEIAPRSSVFGGWHDEGTLSYVVASPDGVRLQLFDVSDFSISEAARFELSTSLRQIWSVGDGTHVVVITGDEVRLRDLSREREGRLLARNCTTGIIAGPAS